MSQIGTPPAGHDPVPIGEVSAPPFARLPDPATLFRDRAARLRQVAQGHDLAPYLDFVASLVEVQECYAVTGDFDYVLKVVARVSPSRLLLKSSR